MWKILEDSEAMNFIKFYKKENTKLKIFPGKAATFKVSKNIKIIKKVNCTGLLKYVEWAKAEIERLIKEDIIEKSFSKIVSQHL